MKKSFLFINLMVFSFMLFSFSAKARPVFTLNPVSDTLCFSADSVNFTATAADSTFTIKYYWQVSANGGVTWATVSGPLYSGDSTASLTINISSGTGLNGYEYRAIAQDTLGSDTSAVATLGVIGNPSAGTIAGASAICVGATATFTDAVAGGVWTATNTAVTTVDSVGMVTGVAAGIDSIVYTATNLCGSASSYRSVQVDTLPNAGTITGLDSLCRGSILALTDTTSGGVWSSSNTSVAIVGSTGRVTGLSQGMDTIKYIVTYGLGCAGMAEKVVRVDTHAVAMAITGPTVTCVGYSITLADPNVAGIFTWSVSNGNATVSSSGEVRGIHGGTDVITYTFSNACNTVDTNISVEIDTLLPTGTLIGSSYVCAGSWVHLTNSLPGGFWLSANSAIATVDGSGNVTGISVGTTAISYLFENGCGARAAVHTITVSAPTSSITAARDSVGVGATLSLADSTAGGTWSSADTAIATVSASGGIVTGISAGITTISYTVVNICGTSYATFTLNVGVPDSLSGISAGDDSVCVGHTLALGSPVAGGVWSNSNNSIATVSPIGILTGISQGLDTVTYTVTNAYGTSSTSQAIYVNHTPVIAISGPSIVAKGSNYFPIAVPAGGVWTSSNSTMGEFVYQANYLGDTMIGGQEYTEATFGSFVVIAAGTDTLKYTVTNSCGTVDSIFVVSIPIVNGVNTITGAAYAMGLYPNPNNGTFTLTVPSADASDANVVITDLIGRKVKEMAIQANQKIDINLGQQPAGIYFVTATVGNNKYVSKFTIAK